MALVTTTTVVGDDVTLTVSFSDPSDLNGGVPVIPFTDPQWCAGLYASSLEPVGDTNPDQTPQLISTQSFTWTFTDVRDAPDQVFYVGTGFGSSCDGGFYNESFYQSPVTFQVPQSTPPAGTMSASTVVSDVVIPNLTQYGWSIFYVLVAVIGISVAWLVFVYGRSMLRSFDYSGSLFGFYYAKTPYKGYNRFRSKDWNIKNTMN